MFTPAALNGGDKKPGDKVEIRIRGNGTGIPPDVREKMFSPFFTTKPAGEDTGLGLSITHDIIVKQHSGSIEVDSQPGGYTQVCMFCRACLFHQVNPRQRPPTRSDYRWLAALS